MRILVLTTAALLAAPALAQDGSLPPCSRTVKDRCQQPPNAGAETLSPAKNTGGMGMMRGRNPRTGAGMSTMGAGSMGSQMQGSQMQGSMSGSGSGSTSGSMGSSMSGQPDPTTGTTGSTTGAPAGTTPNAPPPTTPPQ